jgi:hypothetical protein
MTHQINRRKALTVVAAAPAALALATPSIAEVGEDAQLLSKAPDKPLVPYFNPHGPPGALQGMRRCGPGKVAS